MNADTSLAAPATQAEDRSSETTAAGVPWLAFARHRAAVRDVWPDHWSLPIDRSLFGPIDRAGIWPASKTVLDVGATDRRHRSALEIARAGIEYRSLDVDRTSHHDYHDFADLDRTFDLVICLEVLEHVAESTAIEIVGQCASACTPGGHVFLTVPNFLVPAANIEFTHRTSFTHLDLGAIARLAGLEVVDIARGNRGAWRTSHSVHRMLGRWHRFMRTDWSASVTCLARRPVSKTLIEGTPD